MHRAVLLLLLAPALAGCFGPEEEAPEDPLLGVCPQWVPGDWNGTAALALSGAATDMHVLSPSLEDPEGRTLDLYRFTFHNVSLDGTLQLRAYADEADRRLGILDHRDPEGPELLPVLTLGPDSDVEGQDFQVVLAALEHGSPPAPDALRLEWGLDGGSASLELQVTALYRVCGAVVE